MGNSNSIKQVQHQPVQPVSIERDFMRDEVIIEGVRYSGNFFRTMALPDPDYLYALRRDEDAVVVTTVHSMQEAMTFFIQHQAHVSTMSEENDNDNSL